MKRNLTSFWIALMALAIVGSSCADLDITKRRYRPGYHIDMAGKKEHRKADQTASAEKAKPAKAQAQSGSEPANSNVESDQTSTASASAQIYTAPVATKKTTMGEMVKSDYEWFKNTLFNRANVRNEVKKITLPMYGARNDWMAWVCFGAGIASSVFGLFGIIFAFLFGSPIWALAIVFGIAAVVFGFIHKNNAAGGESWRRIGFILGWVGIGLGVIGMIIYIVWIALALSPLL